MTIEAPDYFRVVTILQTPESELRIYTFQEATELLREGKYVAEIMLNRDAANPYYLSKVYKFDKEFFQVNLHLGTFIKTSTFDMFTNRDTGRKFIVVAVIKNVETDMTIKGSSSQDTDEETDEDMQTFEISTPPMFFETETGDLISKEFILKNKKTLNDGTMFECARLTILGHHYEYFLDEKEEARFREFAKLHGIFGKGE